MILKFNEDKYPQIINTVYDKVIPNCSEVESTPLIWTVSRIKIKAIGIPPITFIFY